MQYPAQSASCNEPRPLPDSSALDAASTQCPPLLSLRAVACPPRLKPVTLNVNAGECCAIMGASGSGKSLLLRQIADLDPGSGEVELAGQKRSTMPATVWRKKVAYCQPKPGWWTDRAEAHFPADKTSELQQLITALGLRHDILSSMVYTLSSGESQRLGLARSLLQNPDVLLLDEPTASLDDNATAAVEALIKQRRQNGCAIILVTHSEAQARRLAGQCWLMQDGVLTKSWL